MKTPGIRTICSAFLFVSFSALAQEKMDHCGAGSDHHAGVNARGDKVMGFDHEKTTHHFLLSAAGGSIEVTANSGEDKESRDAIRAHLAHIAKLFSEGDFEAPMLIHDRIPPGVDDLATALADRGRREVCLVDLDLAFEDFAEAVFAGKFDGSLLFNIKPDPGQSSFLPHGLGGILLLLGIYTRWAALVNLPAMLGDAAAPVLAGAAAAWRPAAGSSGSKFSSSSALGSMISGALLPSSSPTFLRGARPRMRNSVIVTNVALAALIGGVTATLLWEVMRHILAWYYTTMSQIQLVYGSLTTAIAVLLSVEIGALVLLVGAQVIAEYERVSREPIETDGRSMKLESKP